MKTNQSNVATLERGRSLPPTRTLQRFAEATAHRLIINFEPLANGWHQNSSSRVIGLGRAGPIFIAVSKPGHYAVRPPRICKNHRLSRERAILQRERVRHVNRIKGLLASQGIADYCAQLAIAAGHLLSPCLQVTTALSVPRRNCRRRCPMESLCCREAPRTPCVEAYLRRGCRSCGEANQSRCWGFGSVSPTNALAEQVKSAFTSPVPSARPRR